MDQSGVFLAVIGGQVEKIVGAGDNLSRHGVDGERSSVGAELAVDGCQVVSD